MHEIGLTASSRKFGNCIFPLAVGRRPRRSRRVCVCQIHRGSEFHPRIISLHPVHSAIIIFISRSRALCSHAAYIAWWYCALHASNKWHSMLRAALSLSCTRDHANLSLLLLLFQRCSGEERDRETDREREKNTYMCAHAAINAASARARMYIFRRRAGRAYRILFDELQQRSSYSDLYARIFVGVCMCESRDVCVLRMDSLFLSQSRGRFLRRLNWRARARVLSLSLLPLNWAAGARQLCFSTRDCWGKRGDVCRRLVCCECLERSARRFYRLCLLAPFFIVRIVHRYYFRWFDG